MNRFDLNAAFARQDAARQDAAHRLAARRKATRVALANIARLNALADALCAAELGSIEHSHCAALICDFTR